MSQEVSRLLQILTYHLGKDTEVLTICGGAPRVFVGWSKDAEEATRQGPALILVPRGGPSRRQAPVAARTLWLVAYAPSTTRALQLYEAAKAVLHTEGLTAPPNVAGDPCFELRAYCTEADGPTCATDDLLGLQFARGTWTAWTMG